MGTDRRQNISARSTGPSMPIRMAVGIAFVDVGSARSSAGSIRRPSDPNSTTRKSAAPGFAFVPAAVAQDDEAVAVRGFLQRPRARDRRDVLALLDRVQEDIANGAVERVDALDEDHEIGTAELAKEAGREQRDLVAGLELPLVLELALFRPRREEERQDQDRNEERGGKPEYRPQPSGEPLARGKPDDHLAVAVPAGEREQHGDEDRDRQQNVEIEQRVEAQQRQDALRRDDATGRAGQQAEHQVGEQDREENEEQAQGRRRHLAHEAASENHDAGRILTFLA